MFKNSLTALLAITTGISSVSLINNHDNNINLTTTNDIANNITQKYTSANTNPEDINFVNIYNDIVNSNYYDIMIKKIKLYFSIKKTNANIIQYIWYKDLHGSDMTASYEWRMQQDISNLIAYPLMVTIIANIAHYYGEHTEITNRKAAITNDINIISTLLNLINNKNSTIKLHCKDKFKGNPHFVNFLNNLNPNNIIDEVLNQDYSSNLFKDYYNLNYEKMEISNNTLTACDNLMPNLKGTKHIDLWDSFQFGPFKIWILNSFNTNPNGITFDYLYSDPSLYDFQI